MIGFNLHLGILFDMVTRTCLQENLYSTCWKRCYVLIAIRIIGNFYFSCYDAELLNLKKY